MHWLKQAFFDGLNTLDTDALLDAIATHVTIKGEWEQGVISPTLVATQCRLARLKIFIGDTSQPGLERLAVRAGHADHVTQLNFLRGFCMEGAIVSALNTVLGQDRVVGHAPTLLFRWRYQGDDLQLNMWVQGGKNGMVFAGHPDVMVWSPSGELELVQIKSPSIWKFERVERRGDVDALETYRSQMVTEMYIGRQLGYPIQRTHLLLAAWEATPKISDPHCRVITMEWEKSMTTIPEQVAREIVQDYDRAYTLGEWPAPEPEHKWDSWPCSYCRYSRLGTFDTIGCWEQSEWERHAERGETRLTVEPPPDDDPKIKRIRPKRRQ